MIEQMMKCDGCGEPTYYDDLINGLCPKCEKKMRLHKPIRVERIILFVEGLDDRLHALDKMLKELTDKESEWTEAHSITFNNLVGRKSEIEKVIHEFDIEFELEERI